jgi:tetratricopeptide (TPR) repeat protein
MADDSGDHQAALRAIRTLRVHRLERGDYEFALISARRFHQIAVAAGESTDICVGERMLANVRHHLGDQIAARQSYEQMLSRYRTPADDRDAIWFVYDERLNARLKLAVVLALQGSLDTAHDHVESCRREVQEDALAFPDRAALARGAFRVALLRGDLPAAQIHLEHLRSLTVQSRSAYFQPIVQGFDGRLMLRQGKVAPALIALRSCVVTCDRRGWRALYPDFCGGLAECFAGCGQWSEALATIDEAIAWSEHNGGRWFLAELYRRKGEVLLQAAGDRATEQSVTWLRRAIVLARQQGAMLYELRATMSLVRWEVASGETTGAQDSLDRLYRQFDEGFATAALIDAKGLLDVTLERTPNIA